MHPELRKNSIRWRAANTSSRAPSRPRRRRSVAEPRALDVAAIMNVVDQPDRPITLTFQVEDGAGSVSVTMTPAAALDLAEQLIAAATRRLE